MGSSADGSGRGDDAPGRDGAATAWVRVAVFGLLSFLQGVIEPTEGLLSQPVRSRLLGWGRGAGEVAWFAAILGLPWALKPLLGLLSDALPLGGSRRRNYVVASGAVAAAAFLALAFVPGLGGSPAGLLAGLTVASAAVAMSDVATDALVVDLGRADGRTGRYQAAQWFCLYASGIVTGAAGGALSAGGRTRGALLACALAAGLMLLAALGVREPPAAVAGGRRPTRPRPGNARAPARVAVAVAGFLALENFNPFGSSALLQVHMTGSLGYGERSYGGTVSMLAAVSMTAAAVYGAFGPRVPLRALAYASVALGVVSNLAYAGLNGGRSDLPVLVFVGFASMTATLIQFELAARACPAAAAGTVFATFMAVSNLSTALATWWGGVWYEAAGPSRGYAGAFLVLGLAGAASVALGGLIVPFLPGDRFDPQGPGETPEAEDG